VQQSADSYYIVAAVIVADGVVTVTDVVVTAGHPHPHRYEEVTAKEKR
jgi:hypothetical protein